jgi:hypothetical protein
MSDTRLCPNIGIKQIKIMPKQMCTCSLIFGGEKEGKSTVALRTSLEHARNGEYTLLIGNKEKIEKLFTPSIIPALSNNPNFVNDLKYIDVCYADRRDSIIEVLAAVQFYKNKPKLIIVEDLSTLVDPLHTRPRNDVEYLQQVLIVMGHLQDLAASISCLDSIVHVIVTDCCEDKDYAAMLNRCVDYVTHARLNRMTNVIQCYSNRDLRMGYDSMNDLIKSQQEG